MMYFIIVHDCLAACVKILHDIPSYFANHSILEKSSLLYNTCKFIIGCRFFFHLFFLPVFSLFHCLAIYYTIEFRRFDVNYVRIVIGVLYLLTAAVLAPIFTPCCGYSYQIDIHSWYFDYSKPHSIVFRLMSTWLEVS